MPYNVDKAVDGKTFAKFARFARFAKCEDCYNADQVLRNFQEAEVYSRIVGYIRPIKNWNPGKSAEYNDRKVFSNQGYPVSPVSPGSPGSPVSPGSLVDTIVYDNSPLS